MFGIVGGQQPSAVPETRTRIVEDLPESRTEVTEYTVERRYGRTCRKLVESSVPGVLPHAQLGLRLMHAIVQLKVRPRVTVESIPSLLRSLYGVSVSEGVVPSVPEQMVAANGPVYERFREASWPVLTKPGPSRLGPVDRRASTLSGAGRHNSNTWPP